MERNLALEFVRVTEAAALSSAGWVGKGREKPADQAAVNAMRKAFDVLSVQGRVVIGEGERDEAPMLYIGEEVGNGNGPKLDIALDPLEGTTLTAHGLPNAISVIAVAEHGNFLHAPDTYMKKIAVGPQAVGAIDLNASPTENLQRIAKAKNMRVEDLTVIILDRPRHENLIQEVRQAGSRIRLIQDGDVAAAVATCYPETGIDVLMGIGGAPEGVIAAAALRCVGGDMQASLSFRNDEEKTRATKMGINDLGKTYQINELAAGDVMFVATGVTNGDFLKGVRYVSGGAETHSIVMRSKTGTVRHIHAQHNLDRKPLTF